MCKIHTMICSAMLLLLALTATAQATPRQETLAGPITGSVVSIYDGDTVNVRLHAWIGQQLETAVRIDGIDTPEIHGKCASERGKAQEARAELEILLENGKVVLTNIRLEKYAGRVLATVATQDGTSIADHLIGKGLARAYHGKKRLSWC